MVLRCRLTNNVARVPYPLTPNGAIGLQSPYRGLRDMLIARLGLLRQSLPYTVNMTAPVVHASRAGQS